VRAGDQACDGPAADGLRRLAFAYHPRSFGALAIAEAARGTCELVWIVDTTDPEVASMVRLLRRLGPVVDVAAMPLEEAASSVAALRPDGILALADTLLLWSAELAQRLELPFIAPEVARRLTDKHAQRTALRDAGLPVPGFWRIPDAADAEGWAVLAREATFPALLKPRQGEGSREVTAVHSLAELRSLLAASAQAAGSEPAQLVLEEYLRDRSGGGPFASYVSVESLVCAGRISHLAITGRFPLAEPFRETGFFIPSALDPEDQRAVLEVASAAVGALGVSIGCLHTEIKLTPDGPRVIEINGRIGGGVPEMLGHATGVELLPLAMRLALGDHIAFEEPPECVEVGYLFYVQAPASMRRIVAVEGLDGLRADPSVQELILSRGPGRSVDWREGNHGHVFSVRGFVADHEALKTVERRIHAEVQIHGE
jgi:biotin carboxylase